MVGLVRCGLPGMACVGGRLCEMIVDNADKNTSMMFIRVGNFVACVLIAAFMILFSVFLFMDTTLADKKTGVTLLTFILYVYLTVLLHLLDRASRLLLNGISARPVFLHIIASFFLLIPTLPLERFLFISYPNVNQPWRAMLSMIVVGLTIAYLFGSSILLLIKYRIARHSNDNHVA